MRIIEPIDDSELQKKPSDDSWSVVQVFNHLLEVEKLSLDYLEYKEKENAIFSKESFFTKIKFLIYKIALILPLRFKMPSNLSQPSNEGGLESIQKGFSEIRVRFEGFLERQNEEFLSNAVYKHVIVGRISLAKMFVFLRLHLKHHEKQILRTLIKIAK